ADVLKIEHPETGDPQRGLMTMGIMPGGGAGVDFMMEFPNRGKRSVAIDIATDDGRTLLYRLAEVSDVFLTNFLPHTRRNLRIDVGSSAALYAREKTGEPPVVDVSLLGTAMWQIQPDIVISRVLGMDDVMRFGDRKGSANPLVGTYRTKDDRYIFLNMMQSDR